VSRPSLDDVFLKHTGRAFTVGELAEGGGAWWKKWQKGSSASSGNGSSDGQTRAAESPASESAETANGEGNQWGGAKWPRAGSGEQPQQWSPSTKESAAHKPDASWPAQTWKGKD
jgi:hypothetical protein